MIPTTILSIDDDNNIREMISAILTDEGMNVLSASNENEAYNFISTNKIDLILLDLNLDDVDGMDVLRKIKNMDIDIPILILSAKFKPYNKILGLGLGADDYITKPFDDGELVARVKAHLRRYKQLKNNVKIMNECIIIDTLKLDLKNYKLYKNNKEIEIPSRHIRILQLFMENPGRVFSKEQIYNKAWDDSYFDENTILVYISELRKKIEDDTGNPRFIKTVRGIGYKFMD